MNSSWKRYSPILLTSFQSTLSGFLGLNLSLPIKEQMIYQYLMYYFQMLINLHAQDRCDSTFLFYFNGVVCARADITLCVRINCALMLHGVSVIIN